MAPVTIALGCSRPEPVPEYDRSVDLHHPARDLIRARRRRSPQRHPIGYAGSDVNLYAYAANPLVHVDVLGLTHSGKAKGNDGSSDGQLSSRDLRRIMKAFEGRDLGKRGKT